MMIKGNIENGSCCTIGVHSKTILKPDLNPQNSPFGPQKAKNDPQIDDIKVRIEGNKLGLSWTKLSTAGAELC